MEILTQRINDMKLSILTGVLDTGADQGSLRDPCLVLRTLGEIGYEAVDMSFTAVAKPEYILRGALNVPFLLWVPHMADGGEMRDELISLMDVGPTLVELAGGTLSYPQFGRNVLDGTPRRYVLSGYVGEMMYMEKGLKLVTNRKGEPYLIFALKRDPGEQDNLAGTPEGAQIWTEKSKQLFFAVAENSCYKPSVIQMRTPDQNDPRFVRSVKGAG